MEERLSKLALQYLPPRRKGKDPLWEEGTARMVFGSCEWEVGTVNNKAEQKDETSGREADLFDTQRQTQLYYQWALSRRLRNALVALHQGSCCLGLFCRALTGWRAELALARLPPSPPLHRS